MSCRVCSILLLLVLLWPGAALAQSPTPPPPAPAASTIAALPDLVGYVTFELPPLLWACEVEPQLGDWSFVLYPFAWLSWKIRDLIRDLVCLLLNLAQFFANLFATVLNMALGAVNTAWHYAIFGWLTVRAWFYGGWYLFEVLRDALGQLGGYLALLSAWVGVIIDAALTALALVGDLLIIQLNIFLAIVGLFAWIGGLVLGFIGSIIGQLSATSYPAMLADTHPIYIALHGMTRGLRDSQVAWLLYLLYGMVYVAFVTWLSRFLSSGGDA